METEGFLLLPSFANPSILSRHLDYYKKRTEYIFNGPGKNDHRRRQVTLPESVTKSLQEEIQYLPFLTESHFLKDFVLLHSLPGCERQSAHTDYIPDSSLLQCEKEKLPYLFLFALEQQTKLVVWPGSHKVVQGRGRTVVPIEPKVIELKAGDALVFRPDLVHAGAEYDVENFRIHCYIDSVAVKRDPNRTWIIQKHADELVQSKILE